VVLSDIVACFFVVFSVLFSGALTLLVGRQEGHPQWCIGGYTRVYGVYQPPGFFLTAYTHLSDHK